MEEMIKHIQSQTWENEVKNGLRSGASVVHIVQVLSRPIKSKMSSVNVKNRLLFLDKFLDELNPTLKFQRLMFVSPGNTQK